MLKDFVYQILQIQRFKLHMILMIVHLVNLHHMDFLIPMLLLHSQKDYILVIVDLLCHIKQCLVDMHLITILLYSELIMVSPSINGL